MEFNLTKKKIKELKKYISSVTELHKGMCKYYLPALLKKLKLRSFI